MCKITSLITFLVLIVSCKAVNSGDSVIKLKDSFQFDNPELYPKLDTIILTASILVKITLISDEEYYNSILKANLPLTIVNNGKKSGECIECRRKLEASNKVKDLKYKEVFFNNCTNNLNIVHTWHFEGFKTHIIGDFCMESYNGMYYYNKNGKCIRSLNLQEEKWGLGELIFLEFSDCRLIEKFRLQTEWFIEHSYFVNNVAYAAALQLQPNGRYLRFPVKIEMKY